MAMNPTNKPSESIHHLAQKVADLVPWSLLNCHVNGKVKPNMSDKFGFVLKRIIWLGLCAPQRADRHPRNTSLYGHEEVV